MVASLNPAAHALRVLGEAGAQAPITPDQAAYEALVMRERDLHAAHQALHKASAAMAQFCPVKVGQRFEYDGSVGGRACKRAMRVTHIAFVPATWSKDNPLQWRIRGLVLKSDGTEGTRMAEATLPVVGIAIAPEHQL